MLRSDWHANLQALDHLETFPPQLVMIYRVAALLRGLGLALHQDLAVGEAWRPHAVALLNQTRDNTRAT
jgi:aarF domain-containing kinase